MVIHASPGEFAQVEKHPTRRGAEAARIGMGKSLRRASSSLAGKSPAIHRMRMIQSSIIV
jgi:hypothetical protein